MENRCAVPFPRGSGGGKRSRNHYTLNADNVLPMHYAFNYGVDSVIYIMSVIDLQPLAMLTDGADFEIAYREGRVGLSIPQAHLEHTGQYMCTAKNKAGEASSTVELVVIGESKIPTPITRSATIKHRALIISVVRPLVNAVITLVLSRVWRQK